MKPDIKGLLKLGRFLKRLPKDNFNQGLWFMETKAERKEDCGTKGCVAGWAMTLFPHRFKKIAAEDFTEGSYGTIMFDVEHRRTGQQGTEAFAAGFKISGEEAHKITDGEAHRNSPKVAARNIFSLVKRLKRAAKK